LCFTVFADAAEPGGDKEVSRDSVFRLIDEITARPPATLDEIERLLGSRLTKTDDSDEGFFRYQAGDFPFGDVTVRKVFFSVPVPDGPALVGTHLKLYLFPSEPCVSQSVLEKRYGSLGYAAYPDGHLPPELANKILYQDFAWGRIYFSFPPGENTCLSGIEYKLSKQQAYN
jgi:hypothetical protein